MSHDVVGVAKHWDVAALTGAVRHERDARVCRRLLALRHLAQGHTVAQTAGHYALGKSVLYDWIRRFDAQGIEALRDRARSGQPPHLGHEHEAAFLSRLHQGPPADSGLAAWRGEDLRSLLRREFAAEYSLGGVYALLHRLGQSSLVPRPRHPESSPAAQAAFKKRAAASAPG
jgi:transposase